MSDQTEALKATAKALRDQRRAAERKAVAALQEADLAAQIDALTAEVEHQEKLHEPDPASDEVVLPGRQEPPAKPEPRPRPGSDSTPTSTTDSKPNEGNKGDS